MNKYTEAEPDGSLGLVIKVARSFAYIAVCGGGLLYCFNTACSSKKEEATPNKNSVHVPVREL